MAAKGGESKAGLVTFLVLFILATLTLGVTTYYGYDAADKAAKDKAEADKKAKDWENDKDYWKFLALTYRSHLGLPATKDDLPALRAKVFSGGQLAGRDDYKEDHRKAVAETLKWDDTTKKPARTYQEEIDNLKKEVADKEKAAKNAQEEQRKTNELAASTQRELDEAKKDYANKLAERKKQDDADLQRLQDQVTGLQKALEAKGEVALKELGPLQDENKKLRQDNKKLNTDLTQALKTIKERGIELARTSANEEIDVSKISPDNLGRIASISGAGDMPYISLGSADNLRRGVTFAVYGKGADGRPLKEPKGRLEVVRIAGEHLAQARVTDLRDEKRDPILVGDFLFNPAWNPNLKQHVAIIGTIDLTGDGHDDIQEFIRNLKNQNVEVDAWLDMKTLKLNGGLTRQTDMLIIGAYPDFGAGTIRAGDAVAERKNDAVKEMQKVQDEAEKLGVRIVRLNSFLQMSGYSLPKPVGAEKGKGDFHRTLPAAGSPVERRQPQK
jgi:hypothetical protein